VMMQTAGLGKLDDCSILVPGNSMLDDGGQ
jgi:hypothetical protein